MSLREPPLRGAAAARAAADNLVKKLKCQIDVLRKEVERLRSLQYGPADEVSRRECIARPALRSLVAGDRLSGGRRLRRNVAWHAAACPSADAPREVWLAAQTGPRLGAGVPSATLAFEMQGKVELGVPQCDLEFDKQVEPSAPFRTTRLCSAATLLIPGAGEHLFRGGTFVVDVIMDELAPTVKFLACRVPPLPRTALRAVEQRRRGSS